MSYTKHLITTSFNRIFKVKLFNINVWSYFAGSSSIVITIFFFFSDKTSGEKTIHKILISLLYGVIFYISLLIILLIASIYLNIKDNLYYNFFESKLAEIEKQSENKINELTLLYENNFSQIINLLNKSFIKIHNFKKKYSVCGCNFKNETQINKDFMECLITLCINLKEIFELTSKRSKNYSISIKFPTMQNNYLIGKVNEQSSIKTICRDPSSMDRESDFYIKTEHTIIGNTAFNNALYKTFTRDKLQYYVNENIPLSKDYLNTSMINSDKSTLKYKSELVFPLINIENNNYDCYGFICCDCNEENGFQYQFHKDIVAGICDGLYDFIELREKLISKIQKSRFKNAQNKAPKKHVNNNINRNYGNNKRN